MTVSQEDVSKSHAWLQRFYEAADSLDASRYIKGFFTPNAELTLGQTPTMHGHDELLPTITGYLTVFDTMKHVVGHADVLPDRIYQQVNVHYLVKGDAEKEETVVKALAVFHKGVEDEKVHRLDVYGDYSKLMEKLARCAA